MNQPTSTPQQACSSCTLGGLQVQLNSPFGYDSDAAASFSSVTSSCSATGYPITVPTPYPTVNTGSTPTATGTVLDSSCVKLYPIKANETCNSIAVSQNVSTYAVYGPSALQCDSLPVGSSICLFGPCRQYQVKSSDSCDSIIAAAGLSIDPAVFLSWNPNIDALCTNIKGLVGEFICLR